MKKTCATCEFGHTDELMDRYCVNDESEYCTDYVGEHHSCPDWTGRKERQDDE